MLSLIEVWLNYCMLNSLSDLLNLHVQLILILIDFAKVGEYYSEEVFIKQMRNSILLYSNLNIKENKSKLNFVHKKQCETVFSRNVS